MKLLKIVKYTGTMKLITGLSIKGNGNVLSIGGAEAEVIKNPITGMPYIPGSSIKGKMRSRMELITGKYNLSKGEPCGCGGENGECLICTVFGAHKKKNPKSGPTRIIVRDCELTNDSVEKIKNLPLDKVNYLEIKTENTINRNTGGATPRTLERVPAGFDFQVEIVLQIFEGDDEAKMKKFIEDAVQGVEDSYLGGSGSRGYGQVKFDCKWK